MFHPARLLATCLVLALAGCATTTTHAPKNRPPDLDLRPNTPPVRPAPAPKIVPKPTPKPAPPTFTVPTATWIPLERWVEENHVGRIINLHSSIAPTFSLITPTGSFVLRVGSRLAQWSGLELRLGFAPQLIGDKPCIHTLDLQKNLLPLLSPSVAPLPGPRVIVLDPGHGGKDSGSRSATGKLEKDYTLDWARRLQPLLEAVGWRVFLTRTNDTDLTLSNRVEFADACHADLFLSLHFNATTGNGHAGIETYCITPTGMPSNVTRDYEDNAALVFPNNHFDTQNLQLAMRLHREIVAATGGQDRGVRHARYLTVVRGQNRPAVLVEGGYLSNAEEAKLIESPEHRQKLAEAIAKALQQP